MSSDRIEITATFYRRIYRTDDGSFCIGYYQTGKERKYENFITCVGANLPEFPFPVTFSGEWVNDPKYGRQFRVEWVVTQLPNAGKDIISFIASTKVGIGEKRAARMLALVGEADFWSTLQNNPEIFLQISGINANVINLLQTKVNALSYQKSLLQYFHGDLHLDGNRYKRICAKYQNHMDQMLPEIQANPFILQMVGYTFAELDYFCSRNTQFALTDNRRLTAATIQVLLDAQRQSHVGLPVDMVPTQLRALLSHYGEVSTADCVLFLNELLDSPYIVKANGMFYLTRTFDDEQYVAEAIKKKLSAPKRELNKESVEEALAEYGNAKNFTLSDDQKNAIYTALTNSFCVITGGPGTGKSTILDALLVCWKRFYKESDWLLMAPTGKAAVRMSETTGEPASTIHSALHLGVSDGEFNPDACGQTPGKVDKGLVVVDEASMIDLPVATALFKAITESGQHLVLVGDPEQLPSVGCGNILADLISSQVVPVCSLNTIYRQAAGNPIITNSTKMRNGDIELDWSNRSFRRYHHGTDEENMEVACKFFMRCVNQFGIKNVAMLSPYHKRGDISTDSLNKLLQESFNPDKGQPSVKGIGQTLRFGDRVMQLRNTETASNGDVGTICSVNPDADPEDPCVTVKFDAGIIKSYTKDELNQLELAYAFTIHKAQGSQYSCVVMVFPTEKSIFLRRNLLYTGITRASKYVAIIGPNKTLQYAIQNNKLDQRYTALAQLLKK